MPALNGSVQNSAKMVIGSFQAKTYFSELLRKVEAGTVVTITRNGHDVAIMQSPDSAKSNKAVKAWRRLNHIAQEISDCNAKHPVSLSDIEEWKNDGRK